MIVILLFNLLFRYMSSFRGVRGTYVQMPMLRGSRGWLYSVLEAPDAVSQVYVDLAYNGPLVVVWMISIISSTVQNVELCAAVPPTF